MDALTVLDTGASKPTVRGIKRKAISTVGKSAKRVRGNITPADSGSLSNASHHGKHLPIV